MAFDKLKKTGISNKKKFMMATMEAMNAAHNASFAIMASGDQDAIETQLSLLSFSLDNMSDISGNTFRADITLALISQVREDLANDRRSGAALIMRSISLILKNACSRLVFGKA